MAVINEQIVTGRKFRKLIDEASRLWLRISFWTMACDVEFNDGEDAETKFSNMANTINDIRTSFQSGVNKIFNYLVGLGFTPNPNSPDGICSAIQNMYNKRYNDGYSDGRTQGHADVVANPSAYGVSTNVKYFDILSGECESSDGIVQLYTCSTTGTYTINVRISADNDHSHNNIGNKVELYIDTEQMVLYNQYYSESSWKYEGQTYHTITRTLNAGTTIKAYVNAAHISDESYCKTVAAFMIH